MQGNPRIAHVLEAVAGMGEIEEFVRDTIETFRVAVAKVPGPTRSDRREHLYVVLERVLSGPYIYPVPDEIACRETTVAEAAYQSLAALVHWLGR